jgi:hypothetical protein
MKNLILWLAVLSLPQSEPAIASPTCLPTTAILDNTGTITRHRQIVPVQSQPGSGLVIHDSLEAERGGFEPPVRFDPHTAFPVPHNRPLCHLSGLLSASS